jgi:hypothetical protein
MSNRNPKERAYRAEIVASGDPVIVPDTAFVDPKVGA